MNLLSLKNIIGGDWPYFFPESLKELLLPYIWNPHWPTSGLGGNQLIILPLKLYLQAPIAFFVNFLGWPWEVVQIFFWFLLPIFLAVFSSFKLTKSWLGSLIFTTNTWILMIFSGGQMGIVLAYSIVPLVLKKFIDLFSLSDFRITSFKPAITAGLVLSLQLLWDVRITYLTLIAVGLYFLFNLIFTKTRFNLKGFILIFGIPFLVTVLLHAFWLLPLIKTGFSSWGMLGEAFSTSQTVKFFSFADFSNSLSLLHPNWPENIFGKVYFMRPEFLLLPTIAFASLFFLKNSKLEIKKTTQQYNNLTIIYFCFLALMGAFLAKGANEPFGEIYIWMFNHVVGMNMFRDPTKFYVLVVLSYSVLIPFGVRNIADLLISKNENQKYLPKIFLILVVGYWLFLIKPIFSTGIFKIKDVPQEYIILKDFLVSQPQFFRTFWVPQQQRFTFYNSNHPAISAESFFNVASTSAVIKKLKIQETEKLLSEASIKYVIIPYDSDDEIFLDDRKYSLQKRKETENELDKISFLKKIANFKQLTVYETLTYYDHFWLDQFQTSNAKVKYEMINPTKYAVFVQNLNSPVTLIFSESYDINWKAIVDNKEIKSQKYADKLNSFLLTKQGDYKLLIEYKPQQLFEKGFIISSITLIILLVFLGGEKLWNKKLV